MVGVTVVVVRRDLAVTGGTIETERLRKVATGIQSHEPAAEAGSGGLQASEQPATNAATAHRRVDPHALDLRRGVLLWIGGNAPLATLTGRDNYFQGGKGIPRPLLLTRDAGAGPLHHVAAQVLALSKMDWNNDSLYDGLPCTVRYAGVLARTIRHMPNLAPQPYDYRLFM